MPFYDYRCSSCDIEFTELQPRALSSDDERAQGLLPDCPKCESKEAIERAVSKDTSFQLQGGGWARDRYGR